MGKVYLKIDRLVAWVHAAHHYRLTHIVQEPINIHDPRVVEYHADKSLVCFSCLIASPNLSFTHICGKFYCADNLQHLFCQRTASKRA